ncbi:MAG: tyrosine-type recombinase/integrase [Bacteroidales bacterium]|nr:tyrosine-type recombinase/integrase [Bacteroidales bacterium]
MPLDECIERFRNYIATERRLAPGTVRNYMADLEDFAAWLAREEVTTLDQVTAREVRAWQMEHMDRGEVPGTVKRRLSSLSSFFLFLRRRGYLDTDIMAKVSPPRQPKRLPVFFKEGEVEHLYDEGIFPDDFLGRRDRLMLRMLYETGIRRSELANLQEHSADLSALTLKVLGKRNKERIIPIESELAHNILEYIALKGQEMRESPWLFVDRKGRQITVGEIYRTVKKYMTRLSNADRISPHVFRHSFATHILNEGGNIQAIKELLGHEDLATTEVYTHVTREHLKDVYKHAHPRGRKLK